MFTVIIMWIFLSIKNYTCEYHLFRISLISNEYLYLCRKTSESGEDLEDSHKSDLTADEDNIVSPKNGKHVRWQDLSRINNKKITFKHSKPKKQNTSKIKVRHFFFHL